MQNKECECHQKASFSSERRLSVQWADLYRWAWN